MSGLPLAGLRARLDWAVGYGGDDFLRSSSVILCGKEAQGNRAHQWMVVVVADPVYEPVSISPWTIGVEATYPVCLVSLLFLFQPHRNQGS